MNKFTILTATAGAVLAGALALGAPAPAYADRGVPTDTTSSSTESDNDAPPSLTDAQTKAFFNAIRTGEINSTRPIPGIDLP